MRGFGYPVQGTARVRKQFAGMPRVTQALKQHQYLTLAATQFPSKVYVQNVHPKVSGREA